MRASGMTFVPKHSALIETGQPVLGAGDPLQDVTPDDLPGEPGPHADPRLSRVGHRRRYEVVERAVEMGERHIQRHPGDGQDRRDSLRRHRPGPTHRGTHQRQLLVARGLGHDTGLPATADGEGPMAA